MTEASKPVTDSAAQPPASNDSAVPTGRKSPPDDTSLSGQRYIQQPDGERGGSDRPEPTRYGDWEVGGRCTDF